MKNKKEEWKQVEDFPRYLISTKGRAISTVKNITPLKLQTDKIGYKFIRMYPEDARFGYYPNGRGVIPKLEKIHRLVLQAFSPTKDESLQVNHKDGDKANNKLENLEWMTHSDNIRHSWSIGLRDNSSKQAAVKRRKPMVAIHKDGHRRYFESRMHLVFGLKCSRGLISTNLKQQRVIQKGPAEGYIFQNIDKLPHGAKYEKVKGYNAKIKEYNLKFYSKYLKLKR